MARAVPHLEKQLVTQHNMVSSAVLFACLAWILYGAIDALPPL
jgi:hypothetical protein